jgi:hypothetical protein
MYGKPSKQIPPVSLPGFEAVAGARGWCGSRDWRGPRGWRDTAAVSPVAGESVVIAGTEVLRARGMAAVGGATGQREALRRSPALVAARKSASGQDHGQRTRFEDHGLPLKQVVRSFRPRGKPV